MDGFNSTVFAYGATGAGKTHTMLGNAEKPGIMFQTMRELFKIKEEQTVEREYTIRISFLEIYNEQIRDLLKPGADHDEKLSIAVAPAGGCPTVSGVGREAVPSVDAAADLVRRAAAGLVGWLARGAVA